MSQLWISAIGLCGASVVGSVLGFVVKELPHKWNDTVLGYCAGVMLAASSVGLIVPAFDMTPNWWMVVVGVMAGALFLNVLDLVTPHLHHITGLDAEEHRNNSSLNRILLFVMAIALHKLPEGMAAGVSVSNTASDGSLMVSAGIALQNVPEGMVIIAPLLLAGVKKLRTFAIALAISLLEVVGIMLGYVLGSASAVFLPIMLGFAGGAMLYVTSDEMIPETHAHGYQKQATYALLLGFVSLLLIEKCL
ncbi:MAG: ZIP family metal transporter [Bacteroidales bacterium]|nr:ZIP family metal transporter [Candidatus Sodaliphilus aphodohippi]